MTLIDMAIFMVVLGLLAVPLIQSYNNYIVQKARSTTESNMLKLDKAIADFYFANGRYPCPSDITLVPTNLNYGHEDQANCMLQPVAAGTTHGGGVPFIDLNVPEATSLDGWNNRIAYTVTDTLRATPWPGATPPGAITINGTPLVTHPVTFETVCGAPVVGLFANVHYLFVSYGPDGAGATSKDGVPVAACPVAGVFGSERENCNQPANDTVFYYDKCGVNANAGNAYYDDMVSPAIATGPPNRTWVYSTANTSNIVTGASNVGINNPAPAFGIDAMGNIRAGNPNPGPYPAGLAGNLVTDQICDGNGQNCFNPVSIGGIDPLMDCRGQPNGTAMAGIWDPTPADPAGDPTPDASPNCGTFLPTITGSCPVGQFVYGFDATGNVRCQP